MTKVWRHFVPYRAEAHQQAGACWHFQMGKPALSLPMSCMNSCCLQHRMLEPVTVTSDPCASKPSGQDPAAGLRGWPRLATDVPDLDSRDAEVTILFLVFLCKYDIGFGMPGSALLMYSRLHCHGQPLVLLVR